MMTREELISKWVTDPHADPYDDEFGFRRDLDALLRAERKQTLERAAKAVCPHCHKGDRAETHNGNYWYTHGPERTHCMASRIHALITQAETPSPGEVEP